MKELCNVEGCCNKAMPNRTHGLCRKHYEISLHGCTKKRVYPKSDKACCVEGCSNMALIQYKHGLCSKHYKQIRECGEVYKTKNEEYWENRSALVQSVLNDLRSGIAREEVRKKYNLDRGKLKTIVAQNGDDSLKIDQSLTAEQIAQKIIDNGVQFEYAGEYKRGSHVLLRCKVCGEVVRYSNTVIYQKHLQCKECKRMEREQRQQQAEKQKAEKSASREQERAEAAKQRAMQHEAKRREIVCPVCGETFITYNAAQITCSSECNRKRKNAISSRRKDKRIPKDKRIDRIDLHDLFKRDGGVCHICGKQCNWNDYTQTGTAFIAGNLYPSVDHVVPVSLGGADSWDNVMLAHRICNSIRRNNVE